MKLSKTQSLAIFLMTVISSTAFAAAPPIDIKPDSVVGIITASMAPAMAVMTKKAMLWLGAFASIQFVVTQLKVLLSESEIGVSIGKLIGSLIWIGFCSFLILNAPKFIGDVGDSFFTMLPVSVPSPADIMATSGILSATLAVIATAAGQINSSVGNFLFDVVFFIFFAGAFFAVKILMIHLELGLVMILSPISFAFMGLDTLREQGIAPFKGLISIGMRVIMISLIMSAFSGVSGVVSSTLTSISVFDGIGGVGKAVETVMAALGAYSILLYMVYKSDSIANTLASGTTNMAPTDLAGAVKSGMMAATTAAAATAAAGAGITSMSDVIKNMMGGNGGEIKQAGSAGAGGQTDLAAGAPVGGGSAPVASLAELKAMAPKEDGAQGGSPAVGGESGSSGGGVTSSSTGGAGGAAGGGSVPAFSKTDGAKAAAAVSGGQARKNTAAVNAAMQAMGANASAAGAAEMVAEKGGSAAEVAAAAAAWNATPAQQAAIHEAFAGAAMQAASNGASEGSGKVGAAPVAGMTAPQGVQSTNSEPAPISGGAGSSQSAAAASAATSNPGEPGWLDSGSAKSPEGGSGKNAGIGGEAQKMSFGDHMKNLGNKMGDMNDHLAREQNPGVAIQMSAHHSS